MPAGAVVAAGVVGGLISSSATSSAARRAASASKYAADAEAQVAWDMYDQTRSDLAPFMAAGNVALNQLTPTVQQVQLKDGSWVNYADVQANPSQYFQVGKSMTSEPTNWAQALRGFSLHRHLGQFLKQYFQLNQYY